VLRVISAPAFAGVLLAFALPFGAVSSCDEEEVRFVVATDATRHVL
jgi:hypothetical protein